MNGESAIIFDFTHMFCGNTGNGVTREEYAREARRLPQVHKAMEEKRRAMAWRGLPFGQGDLLREMKEDARRINERFENFVVLGIGGSALGQRALASALKHPRHNELPRDQRGCVRFYVEDNIDPDGLSALFDIIDAKHTLFNIVTKSGETVETMAQTALVLDRLAREAGGFADHIIAVTDANRGILRDIAKEHGIRAYDIPEGVGGRFSALSPVGLLSAAVLNIDTDALLRGAADMDALCCEADNPAFAYALLHVLAMRKGMNISVMMPYAGGLASTAEWYAQLWAESLGKRLDNHGREVRCGQTPVRALGVTDQHSQMQLYTEGPDDKAVTLVEVKDFENELMIPNAPVDIGGAAYLQGRTFNELLSAELRATQHALTRAGRMNCKITIRRKDAYCMGALLYFFEVATAAAGELLNINAFDQPGVEEVKNATYALMGRKGFERKALALDPAGPDEDTFIYGL